MIKKWLENKRFVRISNFNVAFIIVLALITSSLEALGIGMFYPVFKLLENGSNQSLPNDDYGIIEKVNNFFNFVEIDYTLLNILVVLFSLLFIRSLLTYYRSIYTSTITYKAIMSLKNSLFEKYLNTSVSCQEKISNGEFSNISNREIPIAVSTVTAPLTLATYLILLSVLMSVLTLISWKMTIISIVVFSVTGLLIRTWVNKTKIVGRDIVKINSDLNTFLIERIKSTTLIKLSTTEQKESKQFRSLSNKQKNLSIYSSILNNRTSAILEPLVVSISLTFLYTGYTYIGMSIESIGVYMIISIRMLPLVKSIVQTWQKIKGSLGSMEEVSRVIECANYKREKENYNNNALLLKQHISFINVNYSYTGHDNVLNNLSFKIDYSSSTAFVGPSGCGKSTIMELIPRIRDVSSGAILFDDINIKDFSLKTLRNYMSYVQQNVQIFTGTVREHISYGIEGKKINDIVNAAKLSGSHEFIKRLKNGYNELLSDGAVNLSGGQCQRLDIARAILSGRKILILDEPTSSLDMKAQKYFKETVENIRKLTDTTILIVAHSLYSVKDFDKIIVIDKGKVLEEGRHNELISNGNWYAESWQDQINMQI
jgi:ABC-type bacteriocin/lantibiotic exporter with double-glycine peptidase domain